jgi:hypothetical protein
LSQETIAKQETTEFPIKKESKHSEKAQASFQELVESLKSVADDIGQISELTSEEKLLVAEFFKSLLKLMQPLAPAVPVDSSVLPAEVGSVIQAHVDPTGHIVLLFEDGHVELRDLEEEGNRDLMIAVVEDIMPKFKQLTSAQKRKIEDRIKFLSTVTKEMQKISETLSALQSSV